MNKIDVIIEALELARNEIHDPTLWTDKVDQALATARELKDESGQSEAVHLASFSLIEGSLNWSYAGKDLPSAENQVDAENKFKEALRLIGDKE